MSNHLIHETSPYLLQHAHNPVDWYPWGEEALQRAKEEDKPILVSIGYAACHWCHVMERESFEDAATARLMNAHFINIKIDREERPDLDHIYMDAVQAMSGSGGWPLNVFLTPDKKPFYGGTYFPPRPVSGRASWTDVLTGVAHAFSERRNEIEQQANGLADHLQQTNHFGIGTRPAEGLQQADADMACTNLLQQADTVWGGFGRAPKFPQTFSIQYLLRYAALENNNAALQQALLSLDKMMDGGIYDQVGGGFARYATDTEWLAPHFEKMLYDNALLVAVLSEAYALTKNKKYNAAIRETLDFVQRELTDSSGGFYAALDADSEGVEGKFYVWDKAEVDVLLGDDAAIFCRYYDITEAGNWEGKNILRVLQSPEDFIRMERSRNAADSLDAAALQRLIENGKTVLLNARAARIRPALDDKIILGWNALMNTAYSKAYAATAVDAYKDIAIANMNFLLTAFETADGYRHVWKNGIAKYPAFLDDLAYLVQALLQLHQITAHTQWLIKAEAVTTRIIKDFSEAATPFFYYTPRQQQDVIVRKREVYDGATPSGNAVMAQNLYQLGILLDKTEWRERAEAMLGSLQTMLVKYPTSFGVWLATAYQLLKGTNEIVILGDYESALKELLQQYLPHRIIMAANTGNSTFPMLKDKVNTEALTLYLCQNYTCKQPVHTINELLSQMK